MKTNRRSFLQQSSLTLAGALLFQGQAKAEEQRYDLLKLAEPNANDEAYWQLVRQQFPLTKEWTYLNNGTMGPSQYPVIEAVKKGMMDGDQFANYGGWENAAKKLSAFVGAQENEIALTHNVTDGINIVCWGLPLKKGDEVIVTTHEHVGQCAALAQPTKIAWHCVAHIYACCHSC